MLAIVATIASLTTACSHSKSSASGGSNSSDPRCKSTAKPSTGQDNTAGNTIPATQSNAKNYGESSSNACIYDGAGNFTLDLTKCPQNWNINTGITDNSINLFTSVPHSGALAAYGAIGDGLKSYLNYVNQHGGIYGRKVNLTVDDDQYQPDLTRKNVEAAVQANKYAASFALLGSANNIDVRPYMNQQCMGQYLTGASDDQLFDPGKYPWTSGFGLDYYNEAAIWASALERQFPQGATVALIAIDNALGDAYLDGFKRAIKGTNLKVVTTQKNPATAPNLNDQVTSAAASKAKAAILIEAGTFCTQGIGSIEQSSWKPQLIVSNSCAQIQTTFLPLQKQGLTGNGTETVRYYFAPNDTDNDDPSFAALVDKTLKAQGLDPSNAQYANGWFWGWYVVSILKDASVMKGGLNRATINIATHQYNTQYPLMAKGVRGMVSGTVDAFPFESGQVYKYTGATTKTAGHFVPVGGPISNEGKLGNYSKTQQGG